VNCKTFWLYFFFLSPALFLFHFVVAITEIIMKCHSFRFGKTCRSCLVYKQDRNWDEKLQTEAHYQCFCSVQTHFSPKPVYVRSNKI